MRTTIWYFMPRASSLELLREVATNRQLTVILQRFQYDGFQPGYTRVEPPADLARQFNLGGKPTIHLTPVPLPEILDDWESAAHDNHIMVQLGRESGDAIAVSTIDLLGRLKDSKAAPAYREIHRRIKEVCEDSVLTRKDTTMKIFWHPSIAHRTLYTYWGNPNSVVRPQV